MTYLMTYDKATEFTIRAIVKIGELKLLSTPNNFAILYEYFAESNLNLVRAIDELLSSNQEFSPELCDDLYRRFFTSDQEASVVHRTNQQVQDQLQEIVSQLNTAGDDSAHYGEALTEFSGEVAKSSVGDNFSDLVSKIMADTGAMRERTKQLESDLRSSSEQILDLNIDLETARNEANTDVLTGIANRKHFDTRLNELSMHASLTGEKLCLILCDVDHFKRFNDTWGHQLGDEVLKLVATTLKKNVKG